MFGFGFPGAASAAEYGEIAQGSNYTACYTSAGQCKELFDSTVRGKYWCKAWARDYLHSNDHDLRFRCEIKDTNEDGHGVYVAIKYMDEGHWEMGSGVVGPQGKSEWWHSVGTWTTVEGQFGDSKWGFHLCWYIPGELDPCGGFTSVDIPHT